MSKLKAFPNNKSKVAELLEIVFDRLENIVGKEENSDLKNFLILLNVFKCILFGIIKDWNYHVKTAFCLILRDKRKK